MLFSNVLLLKKNLRSLKPEESYFLQNCNMHYSGQYTNPMTFYSHAVNNNVRIIIFDPKDYENVDHIIEILSSLQQFIKCYIVLCRDIPDVYKKELDIVESNPNITEPMLKISDSLLKIQKIEKTSPNSELHRIYSKIQHIMYELGFDGSKKGFSYLCDAVYYVYIKRTNNIRLLEDVYKYVAEKNQTTDSRVERDLRYALFNGSMNCDHKKLETNLQLRHFSELMIRPTAKTFIMAMVNYLKYNITFI